MLAAMTLKARKVHPSWVFGAAMPGQTEIKTGSTFREQFSGFL